MRRLSMVLLAVSVACTTAPEAPQVKRDAGFASDGGAATDAGTPDAGLRRDAGSPPDAGPHDAGPPRDAGPRDGGPRDAGVFTCDPSAPVPPPASLGTQWNTTILSATGAQTLGGHGHDDGRPPPGFCPAPRGNGRRTWWLRSVRFETDQDLDQDGNHDPLPKDDTAPSAIFDTFGMGESGGRHHVYAEIVDTQGMRVIRDLRIDFQDGGGSTTAASDPGKPPNEFPINVPIWGGNVLTVRVEDPEGDSDAITNLRIPNNHHVDYLLIFQQVGP